MPRIPLRIWPAARFILFVFQRLHHGSAQELCDVFKYHSPNIYRVLPVQSSAIRLSVTVDSR